MVNEPKSRQAEGFDQYDYRVLAFPAAGVVEAPYMVGYESNVAIQGAWSSETTIYPLDTALTAPILAGVVNIPVANSAPFALLPAGTPLILMDQVNSQLVILAAVPNAVTVQVAPPGSFVGYTVVNNATLTSLFTYLPVDAQNTLVFATVACNIRLVNRALFARQVLLALNPADPGGLPAGLPVQIVIPATTWIILPDKWFLLYAVAVGAVAGNIIIKSSG